MWYSALGCIVALVFGLFLGPLTAAAQQAGYIPRIGY